MKKLRKAATVFLSLTLIGGIGMMLWQTLHYSASQQIYDQAQAIAFGDTAPETVPEVLLEIPEQTVPLAQPEVPQTQEIPMDEAARFLREVNIWGLRQINPEVLGWIYIPDTVISYPLMHTTDNQTYLHESWDKKYSKNGSIFLECKNSGDFSDFNTIVYGHHMGNGSMFGTLKHFKKQEYTDAHPNIYICTGDQIFRYRIFSVYDAPIDSDAYRLYYADEQAKAQALNYYISSNLLDTDLVPQLGDSILTLSTCTGTGIYTSRIVVQAVLTGQWKK